MDEIAVLNNDTLEAKLKEIAASSQKELINLNNYKVYLKESHYVLVPKETTDPTFRLTLSSLGQICKIAKVPIAFLLKNPEDITNEIMMYWFPPQLEVEPAWVHFYVDSLGQRVARGFTPYTIKHTPTLEDHWGYMKESLALEGVTPDILIAEGYEASDGALITRFKMAKEPLEVELANHGNVYLYPTCTASYSDCGGLVKFSLDFGYMLPHLPLHIGMLLRPKRKAYMDLKSKDAEVADIESFSKFVRDGYRYVYNKEGLEKVTVFLNKLDSHLVNNSEFVVLNPDQPPIWVERMLDFKGFPAGLLKLLQTALKEDEAYVETMLDVYFLLLKYSANLDMVLPKRVSTEYGLTHFFKTYFS